MNHTSCNTNLDFNDFQFENSICLYFCVKAFIVFIFLSQAHISTSRHQESIGEMVKKQGWKVNLCMLAMAVVSRFGIICMAKILEH